MPIQPSRPDHHADDVHDHDFGLAHDLKVFTARRRALRWLAGAGAGIGVGSLPLIGCGGGGDDGTASASSTSTGTATTTTGTTTTTTTTTTTGTSTCSVIPEETAGPYPADGSNSANGSIANALALSGIVRSDIRSSIAGASGTAAGVPLTVTLTLVNTASSCASLAGYAIYLWHCDRDGKYSLYSQGVTNQNYLRGVQATDSNGQVTFTTIFPACYSGRMPHIHFEVYRNVATATAAGSKLKTSQIAFPTAVCQTVYDTASGYSQSVTNFAQISFATDNVFSDGVSTQTATITGSVAAGYASSLVVGISA